jgi:hypothetical protein
MKAVSLVVPLAFVAGVALSLPSLAQQKRRRVSTAPFFVDVRCALQPHALPRAACPPFAFASDSDMYSPALVLPYH